MVRPAAPPVDERGLVEQRLRIRQARAAKELNDVPIRVGESEDLSAHRDSPAATGGRRARLGRVSKVDLNL